MFQGLNNSKNNVRNNGFKKNLEAFPQIIKANTTNTLKTILWSLDGMFSIVFLTLLKMWNIKNVFQ